MTEITIRNKAMLERLDGFKDSFLALGEHENYEKHQVASSREALANPEYYCGNEYLFKVMANEEHVGFPEEHMGMPINNMFKSDPDKFRAVRDAMKYEFATEIGAHTSALTAYYPPQGFVGWHTNWNACAYQVLFTWSENGAGYFRYWDIKEQRVVHIQDTPGWAARHYYFGHYTQPDDHCWHCAYAGDSKRITLAYKFIPHAGGHGSRDSLEVDSNKERMAIMLRDNMIEELESEE